MEYFRTTPPIAEEFDKSVSLFRIVQPIDLTDKDVAHLMTGWIDFKTNSYGNLEKELNEKIDKLFQAI